MSIYSLPGPVSIALAALALLIAVWVIVLAFTGGLENRDRR